MGVSIRQKTKGGAWWCFAKYDGKRRSRLAGTFEAARAIQIDWQSKALRDDYSFMADQPVAGAAPTIEAIAALWLPHYTAIANLRSARTHESFLRCRIIPFFKGVTIDKLDGANGGRARCEDFILDCRKTMMDSSLKVALPTLTNLLRYAVSRGHIKVNPMARDGGEPIWRPKDDGKKADPFEVAELRRILEAADRVDPDLGTMIRFWANCGPRSAEIRGLLIQDVDLVSGTVTINKQYSDNGTHKPFLKNVKEENVGRVSSCLYPIADRKPKAVLLALKAMIASRPPDDRQPTSPLFVGLRDDRAAMTGGVLKGRWANVIRESGVRFRSPEELRHTHVSQAISQGYQPLAVADNVGDKLQTILSYYTRWVKPATVPHPTKVARHPEAPSGHPTARKARKSAK